MALSLERLWPSLQRLVWHIGIPIRPSAHTAS